jgi:hypothetical protein
MERYLNNFLVYLDGFDILILKIKQIIKKIILMYFFLKIFYITISNIFNK